MTSDPNEESQRRRRAMTIGAVVAVALAVVIVVVVAVIVTGNAANRDASAPGVTSVPQPTRTPDASGGPSTPAPTSCGTATVTVSTTEELEAALSEATAGASIRLMPGRYDGEFTATGQGTSERPIALCGPREAILDGGGISAGYVLHLDAAAHWVVAGFSVQNGQKGVMADATTATVIRDLHVSQIGDEAIHLRDFSTDNTVSGNTIRETGLRKPKFGEGIYVGTAESNWCDVSDCQPDASDRNTIEGNDIAGTMSESIDVKEGTSGGVVRGNTFDGSAIVGADSWVDVKGNDWLIEGNAGTNSPMDGFQTHEILDGWGTDNVFRANTATVNGPGFGFSLTPARDNVVECTNKASGAAEGTTNVECVRT